jgi:hypothetical protein
MFDKKDSTVDVTGILLHIFKDFTADVARITL